MAIFLVGSAAFVAGGIWMWPREPLVGASSVVFFGLGMFVFALALHPKSSFLTLASDGFTFASLFRKKFVAWSSVQSFSTVRIGPTTLVAWNYTPEFREQVALRKANIAVSGIEAALPDTYGMKADKLCQLMNEMRERHGKPAI